MHLRKERDKKEREDPVVVIYVKVKESVRYTFV